MRTRTLIPFLLALFPTACTSGSAPLTANEEAALKLEVSETLAGLTAAMNAHDPEQVFSFYRQDGSFFYVGCTDVLPGWGRDTPGQMDSPVFCAGSPPVV